MSPLSDASLGDFTGAVCSQNDPQSPREAFQEPGVAVQGELDFGWRRILAVAGGDGWWTL